MLALLPPKRRLAWVWGLEERCSRGSEEGVEILG